jgi:hypothetical protein
MDMAMTPHRIAGAMAMATLAAATTALVSEPPPSMILTRAGFTVSTAVQAEGIDLFAPVAAVLRHPRCMNCHPRDERPRQGNNRHPHAQNVVRGDDGLGFVNMRCASCHREENNASSGVPGAPAWHLAPLSMGWQGLADAELCAVLKDETLNGGRNLQALTEHMEKDKVVLWGWEPGGDREPVSTPHAEFIVQFKAWTAARAPCPARAN